MITCKPKRKNDRKILLPENRVNSDRDKTHRLLYGLGLIYTDFVQSIPNITINQFDIGPRLDIDQFTFFVV